MPTPRCPRPRSVPPCARAAHGFTLVEVLVALLIMSVLAAMGWQGIDGMLRARDASQGAAERTLRLGAVVGQLEHDLQAIAETAVVPGIRCDGASLFLTREADGGVQVVVWSLREGIWRRWHSESVTRSDDLQQHWLRAQQLIGNEPQQVRLLDEVDNWQLYFFRGGSWSNCQSSDDVVATPGPPGSAPQRQRAVLPAGVRMVLERQGLALTRDIVLPPQAP